MTKAELQEKIKEILSLLAKGETDGGRNQLWSSIRPERNDQISNEQKQFDTIPVSQDEFHWSLLVYDQN